MESAFLKINIAQQNNTGDQTEGLWISLKRNFHDCLEL